MELTMDQRQRKRLGLNWDVLLVDPSKNDGIWSSITLPFLRSTITSLHPPRLLSTLFEMRATRLRFADTDTSNSYSHKDDCSCKFIPSHQFRSPVLPSPPAFRRRNISANWSSLKTFKMLDSVRAYTVQCANCLKWRFIPTKQKYEKIRETIAELPFFCETAREWRPEITCDDESDLIKDGSWRWAIDKPSIPQPPPGWQRILQIRAEGGTKFSDVYYDAPSGERFRSMVKVQSFLNEHPEYQCVTESQFSFQNPAPMEENYVQKSTPAASRGRSGALVPAPMEENYVQKRRATSAASHEMSGALVPVQTPAPMEEN